MNTESMEKEENGAVNAAECLAYADEEKSKLLGQAREMGWQKHLEALSRLTRN